MFTPTNRSQTFLPKGSLTRDKWDERMILLGLSLSLSIAVTFSDVDTLVPVARAVV